VEIGEKEKQELKYSSAKTGVGKKGRLDVRQQLSELKRSLDKDEPGSLHGMEKRGGERRRGSSKPGSQREGGGG